MIIKVVVVVHVVMKITARTPTTYWRDLFVSLSLHTGLVRSRRTSEEEDSIIFTHKKKRSV